jgi:hypothetical protein
VTSLAKYASHAAFCGWHVDQRDSDCTCAIAPPSAGKGADRPDPFAGKVFELPEGFEISGSVFGDRYPGPSDRCGTRNKPGWYCSRNVDHDGPCAMWPISHGAAVPETQSRTDSLMESLTNIVIGLAISQAANLVVIPLVMGVPISAGQNAALALLYTAISLVRSYAIRRAFNGRSVWSAIKARFG